MKIYDRMIDFEFSKTCSPKFLDIAILLHTPILQEWWPPTIPPSRTNAENSRRISQDSNNGEIGSDAGRGASYLSQASSQGKPLSPPSIHRRRGYLYTDRAALQDEASFYGGRQRSNFTVQAQRCERAGKVLEERH